MRTTPGLTNGPTAALTPLETAPEGAVAGTLACGPGEYGSLNADPSDGFCAVYNDDDAVQVPPAADEFVAVDTTSLAATLADSSYNPHVLPHGVVLQHQADVMSNHYAHIITSHAYGIIKDGKVSPADVNLMINYVRDKMKAGPKTYELTTYTGDSKQSPGFFKKITLPYTDEDGGLYHDCKCEAYLRILSLLNPQAAKQALLQLVDFCPPVANERQYNFNLWSFARTYFYTLCESDFELEGLLTDFTPTVPPNFTDSVPPDFTQSVPGDFRQGVPLNFSIVYHH